MGKKLYKSYERKICGVCGGIAEYMDVDPTIVRLIWILASIGGGIGIPVYIAAAIIMDDKPDCIDQHEL
ncbi:PspC domain-containing protein [Butyrivibrio sp. X503]|uniref:PspC domain-containing protein n=1 Tax=Butyrivibrio sp. X503 TaxID=2364878 RepID=UPI000EA8F130|nr:PspC domain-containing protein [Butyrivibrio sp. X503]RKM53970.1 PspC domain-containing protein [Butyrivibrio sp. X503]